MRLALFRVADAEYRLVWTYSHVLLDGCVTQVLKEVFALYDAPAGQEVTLSCPLKSAAPTAITSSGWSTELPAQAPRAKAYWQQLLAGFATPTNRAREPARGCGEGLGNGNKVVRLSREATDRLRAHSAEHKLNLNVFVQGAWSLVLSASQRRRRRGLRRRARLPPLGAARSSTRWASSSTPCRCGRSMNDGRAALEWLRSCARPAAAQRAFEHTPLVDVQAGSGCARDAAVRQHHRLQRAAEGHADARGGAAVGPARVRLDRPDQLPADPVGLRRPRAALKLPTARAAHEPQAMIGSPTSC